jgi:UDP-GlcNAc:undecaprenyl-phosphate/decaprenyl-phosphate GlcNAc-1-phosphate transferase
VSVALALVVGFLAVRYLLVAGVELTPAPVLQRPNYRGELVPAVGGVLLVAAVVVVEAGRSTLGAFGLGDEPGDSVDRILVLAACLGFGFLGLVDDVLGQGSDRGFRGHLRALASGQLTTGGLKLIGGGGLALVLASVPGFVSGRRLVADALLVALAANLGNLLDRAPGRAIKGTLVAYVPIAIAAGTDPIAVAIAPVMGAAAGLLPDDLRERIMLGDTGANVLGAVLGLAVVLEFGRGVRTGVLVALIAANVAAEFVSFSALIERFRPLRAFDRLGRAPVVPGGGGP